MATFNDIEFTGEAIATSGGKVIWTNLQSGDCPPDIAIMKVINLYTIDGVLVFELAH